MAVIGYDGMSGSGKRLDMDGVPYYGIIDNGITGYLAIGTDNYGAVYFNVFPDNAIISYDGRASNSPKGV
jgi:hypothetical protein